MSFELDPVKYGILWNTVENNEKKLEEMNQKMDKMESKLEELVALANQSRGGFWVGMAVVSAISGIVGFIGSYISSK
jgi:ABC-type antimicrobial peptide transport system permease subunit